MITRPRDGRLWTARAFALACGAMGVVEICASVPLPGLHPWPWTNALVAWLSGALLLAASLWLLRRPGGRAGGWPLAVLWGLAPVCAVVAAVQAPRDPAGWVSAAETLTLAAAAAAASAQSGREARLALSLVLGATLVLFGAVHLLFHEAIAGLVPEWMPFRGLWPWLTGVLQIGLGLGCLWRRTARHAGFATAALFGAWIVLVHAARIAAAPTDAFEWTFALTALALAAAALLTAMSSAAAPEPLSTR